MHVFNNIKLLQLGYSHGRALLPYLKHAYLRYTKPGERLREQRVRKFGQVIQACSILSVSLLNARQLVLSIDSRRTVAAANLGVHRDSQCRRRYIFAAYISVNWNEYYADFSTPGGIQKFALMLLGATCVLIVNYNISP